jgi:hypothetical protein
LLGWSGRDADLVALPAQCGPRQGPGQNQPTRHSNSYGDGRGVQNLDNIEVLTGIFPEETGRQVENLKFRFCHIDVDVYQSAKDVTEWIWERLVPGGMAVYDDYGWDTTPGIARYVGSQLQLKDRTVLHNLNGYAIAIKRKRRKTRQGSGGKGAFCQPRTRRSKRRTKNLITRFPAKSSSRGNNTKGSAG